MLRARAQLEHQIREPVRFQWSRSFRGSKFDPIPGACFDAVLAAAAIPVMTLGTGHDSGVCRCRAAVISRMASSLLPMRQPLALLRSVTRH